MNWDQVAGSWKQLKGRTMQFWGVITNDQFSMMMGKRICIDGRIQKLHGINKEASGKQLAEWMLEHQLMMRSDKH